MAYGGDTNAIALMAALLAGEDVTLPVIDLDDAVYNIPGDGTSGIYEEITRLTNEDLTTKIVDGTGTFDAIMGGYKAHLKDEYDKGRITGAEYTKAFISLAESAMGNAVQYLLGRDGAFWQAAQAQAQAITARVQLSTAKLLYASQQLEAMTNRANYALTKLKLAGEEVTFAQGKFQLETLLPAQLFMVKEQAEAQRAQTSDSRSDAVPVTGLVGKQKDLYNQQIISYQRDGEIKAAKLFTDAYTVMKTIDEGIDIPDNFKEDSLNAILGSIKTNNSIG